MPEPDIQRLRVALTNVSGLGATTLGQSLLPALEATSELSISQLYLPDIGALSGYRRTTPGKTIVYRRYLPKSISRVLECAVLGRYYNGSTPLLVLGDLPINTTAPQVVFVQSPHMVSDIRTSGTFDRIRYQISRFIFRRNQHRVAAFVVQTEAMRVELQAAYAIEPDRIQVIAQPPPDWLLRTAQRRTRTKASVGTPLLLFYPAAAYPHKNHVLLADAARQPGWSQLVGRVVLTIDPQDAPSEAASLVCVGRLAPEAVVAEYGAADALLFLSKAESFGFPLVEAMWIGLPIVCPDLPYARALCGDAAIYFDPDEKASLEAALSTLRERLDRGWWPDWSDRLALLPADWGVVAEALRDLFVKIQRTGEPPAAAPQVYETTPTALSTDGVQPF